MTIIRHLRYTLAEVEDRKIILVQLGMPSKSKNNVLDREFKSKIIDFLASHFPNTGSGSPIRWPGWQHQCVFKQKPQQKNSLAKAREQLNIWIRRIERALLKHLKPKSEVCMKHLETLLIEHLGFRACDHLQLKFPGNMWEATNLI